MYANHDIFEITRTLHHPRVKVWHAWTDPLQLQHWWGPTGCNLGVLRFEFRPGGFFHYAMAFEAAPTLWGRFMYREIATHHCLIWLNSFANENGGILRAPFNEQFPLEVQNILTFTESGEGTTLSLRSQPFGASDAERQFFKQMHTSMEKGYGGTLDQLAAYLDQA